MAHIVLNSVIRKTGDILGNLLVEECTRLYWLRGDILWIQTEMLWMQSFLEDMDEKEHKSKVTENLEREIRDLAYDVEDIIYTYLPVVQTHQRKRFLRYPQCLVCIVCDQYTNHKFVMEIELIRRRVEAIKSARATYSIPDNPSTERTEESWGARQTFVHVDQPIVVGFESRTEELRVKLLDPESDHCIISLVGMAGVGKTTLAKQVYNSIRANFECCAWVFVSQKPSVRDLLQKISKQVLMEKEKWENNTDVEANLYEFLKQKRYLIVLDDIWDIETWDAFTNGIPNGGKKGSRLIISSRDRKVGARAGGESNLHELLPLSDEQSWELFSKIVNLPPENLDATSTSPELREVGRQISQRCRGLPLSIVIMAGLVRQTERKEGKEYAWRDVLDRMDQQEAPISEILALSYRDLSLSLKLCFLCFGLFPEDHEIPVSELMSLWEAEELIPAQISGKKKIKMIPARKGKDYLMELIDRNLIQIARKKSDGSVKSCRIHDVLHSLCISIAREENFLHTCCGDCSESSDIDTRVCRIAIHHDTGDYISRNHSSLKLRALLVFSGEQEKTNAEIGKTSKEQERRENLEHIDEFRRVRVLCLEGLVFPRSFPSIIGNLIPLRYLRLKGSGLRSLPSTIGNLRNLHTLDVQKCEDLILPAIIWKMLQLRHLLLSPTTSFKHPLKCTKVKRRSKLITDVSLPNLESLYTLNGDFLKAKCLLEFSNLRKLGLCCRMKQFAKLLTDGKPISENLEKLHLEVREDGPYKVRQLQDIFDLETSTISDDQSLQAPADPPLNFSGYKNLRKLYLEGPIMRLPEFTASLTKLTLVRSALKQDPMEELGKLPNLKNLQLRQGCYVGFEMVVSGAGSFPRLEVFIVENMPSLKSLKVKEGVMPSLRCPKINCIITLEIQSERLRNIFSEFNDYLMRTSFLALEVNINWPEDDFIWEEDGSILPPNEIADKGKKVISVGQAEQEIVEVHRGFFGNPLEQGQSSLPEAP